MLKIMMDLDKYRQKKLREKEAFEKEVNFHRVKCPACLRSKKACFCSEIQPFSTYFEFRLLMHPKEAKKQRVGTGRLTNIALKKSQIIIGENFDSSIEVQEIIKSEVYFPMLLYPGDQSFDISTTDFPTNPFQGKKPLLFILDGTWPCAKSMMRDSRCLHKLPRLSFSTKIESRFSIKHQPAKFCLSTIESVYEVLNALERQGLEKLNGQQEGLMDILQNIIDFQLKCANDPNLNHYRSHQQIFKDPTKRRTSTKWKSRKICFEEKNFNSDQ